MHIILFEPEIPPNTGNIIRLVANTGATLHLVEPLGFSLDEKKVRRAGLDYHALSRVKTWKNWGQFQQYWHQTMADSRLFAFTTRATQHYDTPRYRTDDLLLFGPETRGLPDSILDELDAEHRLRIPMVPDSRSLNLSNAVAIVLYEALRQQGFPGLVAPAGAAPRP